MGRGRAQGILVIVLLLAGALAGCLAGPQEDDLDTDALPSQNDVPQRATDDGTIQDDSETWPTDDSAQDPEPGNANTSEDQDESGGEPQNETPPHVGPPVAQLLVSTPGWDPAPNATGTAPFQARLHIDARIQGIPYWSLSVTGREKPLAEGHELPATVSHTLVAEGDHTYALFVSDGSRHDFAAVDVRVDLPPPPEPIEFAGTLTGLWVPEHGYIGEATTHSFHLEVPVRTISTTLTANTTAPDLDFELIAPDGSVAARRAGFNSPTGTPFPSQEEPLVIRDAGYTHMLGEWTLRVMPGASLLGDYDLVVTFT